jgi:hypothetical protein
MGRSKAASLAGALFVALAGCQSPPPDTHDRLTPPASQASDPSAPRSDATGTTNSSFLRDDLIAFNKAREEGNLNDQELSKAKQAALKRFLNYVGGYQSPNGHWGEWVHDELVVLAGMKKDKLLDDAGFQEAKAVVMNKYLGTESN